jgi:ribosome-associated protein
MTAEFRIRPEEIRFDFVRASGPGGQNVNKVATAVQLRFDARNSLSLTPEIRERLLQLAGNRATDAGEILIDARRFRTQQRNREDALERLFRLLDRACIPPKIRHRTRPTWASQERRLNQKRRRSDTKHNRNARPADD